MSTRDYGNQCERCGVSVLGERWLCPHCRELDKQEAEARGPYKVTLWRRHLAEEGR